MLEVIVAIARRSSVTIGSRRLDVRHVREAIGADAPARLAVTSLMQDAEGSTDHLYQLVRGGGPEWAGRVLSECDDHVVMPLVVAGQIAQGEHA
jgi:hypothetical protein